MTPKVVILIVVMALVSGCTTTSYSDNFAAQHGGVKGSDSNLCDIYYENVTVIAKNVEITSDGFGSRSVYAIAVKEDEVRREAINLKIYTLMEVNKTYHVKERDLKGCGSFLTHYFWVYEAVPV